MRVVKVMKGMGLLLHKILLGSIVCACILVVFVIIFILNIKLVLEENKRESWDWNLEKFSLSKS